MFEEILGDEGYVKYVDYSDGFTGVYVCMSKLIKVYSLNVFSLLSVNYTSIRLLKQIKVMIERFNAVQLNKPLLQTSYIPIPE